MTVKLSPVFQDAQLDSSGNPYTGAKLFTYAAGSTTKQTAYQDSAGLTPHTNPIVLNSRGEPPAPIWLTSGSTYKLYLTTPTDTDPPVTSVRVIDNVTGVNDTTSAVDEWIASNQTPTYISATSFSVSGDQTATYMKRRRLKSTNTAGAAYSTVLSSSFGASITTVTVVNDVGSNTLDSGLSAVSLGIVRADNPSIDPDMSHRKATAVASAATTDIWATAGDYVHVTGNTGPITSFGTAPYAGAERVVIFDSTPTITHNATTLQCPGGQSIAVQAGDKAIIRADTTANMIIVAFERVNQPATTRGVIASGRNITARTNSGTPNTKLDITADEIQLEDTNGNTFVAKTVSGTIDFGTTGANGLDTGAQASSTWYYGWVIAKPDGTVAVLGSLSATAPTMPSGYTFKALVTAARSNGSTQFLRYRQFGNDVFYETPQSALSAGASSSEATVSFATLVPTIAHSARMHRSAAGTADGSGVLIFNAKIFLVTGVIWLNANWAFSGMSASGGFISDESQFEFPNLQSFIYSVSTSNGSSTTISVNVVGFKLPVGGE